MAGGVCAWRIILPQAVCDINKHTQSMYTILACIYVIMDIMYVVVSLQVNSISWNESGSRLISASDDCHLNFYDTARGIVSKTKLSFSLSNTHTYEGSGYSGKDTVHVHGVIHS